MSDFLIEAILLHHKIRVMHSNGFIYGIRRYIITDSIIEEKIKVSGFTLNQLKEYLNN